MHSQGWSGLSQSIAHFAAQMVTETPSCPPNDFYRMGCLKTGRDVGELIEIGY